jgi:hypothetical protein
MLGLAGPGQLIASQLPDQAAPTLDPNVLNAFCDAQEAAYQQQVQAANGANAGLQDPAYQSACALEQLIPQGNGGADFAGGSCVDSKTPVWCYISGAAAGRCQQTILFTASEPPKGSTARLLCH